MLGLGGGKNNKKFGWKKKTSTRSFNRGSSRIIAASFWLLVIKQTNLKHIREKKKRKRKQEKRTNFNQFLLISSQIVMFWILQNVYWKVLFEMEWFWKQHQPGLQRDPGGQGLLRRDAGLRGRRGADLRPQSDPRRLLPLLQKCAAEEPAPASSALPQGCHLFRPTVSAELHVPRVSRSQIQLFLYYCVTILLQGG